MLFTSPALLSLLLMPLTLAAPIDTTAPSDAAPDADTAAPTAAQAPNIYDVVTQRVIYEVSTLNKNLDQMAHSRPQDRTALATLITTQSNRLVAASKDGASSMRAAAAPNVFQANDLLIPIERLTIETRQCESRWLAIKDIVFQMHGEQKVIQLLKDTNNAAAEFAYAMNAKMPPLVKDVGKLFGDAVDGMVKQVIVAYERPKAGTPQPGWN